MRKSVKIITGFLLTAILSAAVAFASFSDRLAVVNHISVGDISISISEYASKGKGGKVHAAIGGGARSDDIQNPENKKQCTSLLDQGQNHICRRKRKTGMPER